MKDVEPRAVLLRQVKSVKESNVRILRKIRAEKDILVFDHNHPPL
jgi:hypothetical protein